MATEEHNHCVLVSYVYFFSEHFSLDTSDKAPGDCVSRLHNLFISSRKVGCWPWRRVPHVMKLSTFRYYPAPPVVAYHASEVVLFARGLVFGH